MSCKSVCFISLGNIYLAPYISKYTALIQCEYDVIYWDRHNIKEGTEARQTFAFRYDMAESERKSSKLIGYLKFRKFVLDIIKRKQYDGLIILQTNIGILIQMFLEKKYKGRYIVDIRDYSMENNFLFKFIEKRLLNSCYSAVISSQGYKCFLPPFNFILSHNDFAFDDTMLLKFINRTRQKNILTISCIGLIRFHLQNKKVILKFKNDNRYKLRFIGKNAIELKDFCQQNKVYNVELIDRFPPEKTLDYYYDTDIVYNLYGNNSMSLDYALSNKLYYSAALKIPILVTPGTYMEKISVKYGFGHSFDINNDGACDELFHYYNLINWNEFELNCEKFIQEVKRDNLIFDDTVMKFIEGI